MALRSDPPIDIPDDKSRIEALRERIPDDAFANKIGDINLPGILLVLYVAPGVLLAFGTQIDSPGWLSEILRFVLPLFVLLTAALFLYMSGKAGGSDDLNEDVYVDHQLDTKWPWTFPPTFGISGSDHPKELSEQDVEVLLVEYEQISEEVRYRDELMNRTTYFGIAILGILVSVLITAEGHHLNPLLLGVISIIAFVFLTAVNKYKDARDWHWKRQRDLERLIPAFRDQLTVFHSNRTPERRGFDKRFSLTATIINIFFALFFISFVMYVVSVGFYSL